MASGSSPVRDHDSGGLTAATEGMATPGAVEFVFDDFGLTVTGSLRVPRPDARVRALFEGCPADARRELAERALSLGADVLASAAEVSASDHSRLKLEESARRLGDLLEELHGTPNVLREQLRSVVEDARRILADGREEERRVRETLAKNADALGVAAGRLQTTSAAVEAKTLAAVGTMQKSLRESQSSTLDSVEKALAALASPENPAGAPAVIGRIVTEATTRLRGDTAQHLQQLELHVRELLGGSSPLASQVARIAREGAERDLKQVNETLVRLQDTVVRTDVAAAVRLTHDPVVKGDDYESVIGTLFGVAATAYGATVEPTGSVTGDDGSSKKGDWLVVDDAGVPTAAIEARHRRGVSTKDVMASLAGTVKTRGVKVAAYVVPTEDHLPAGVREKARGSLPFTLRQGPDGAAYLIAVVDPTSETVAERVAVLLWAIMRLAVALRRRDDAATAQDTLDEVAARLSAMVLTLGRFRQIKGGLTKTENALHDVRAHVDALSKALHDEIDAMRGLVPCS
jgi:hypothetical protein